jgi:hypothetical protein
MLGNVSPCLARKEDVKGWCVDVIQAGVPMQGKLGVYAGEDVTYRETVPG